MTEKYLYTKDDDKYTRRHFVSRETAHYYFVEKKNFVGEPYEIKVPKKNLTIKNGHYSWTEYYEETQELVESYKKSVLKYKFLKYLDELKKVESTEIMEKILSIKITQ